MIQKNGKCYDLICDICGEVVESFDAFWNAVEGKKDCDIISRKIDGEWQDICEDCQKEEL